MNEFLYCSMNLKKESDVCEFMFANMCLVMNYYG